VRFEEIRTIGVIGGGVMGAGVAQVFAQAGYQVRLHARHQATLDQALARIRANQTQQIPGASSPQSRPRQALTISCQPRGLRRRCRGWNSLTRMSRSISS
jgi:3-hydroxyacyl-CoA dehydrogenase